MSLTLSVLLALACSLPQDDDLVTQEELEQMTAEIQSEVAELRKQEFKRPVAVAVASKAELVEYMTRRMERDSTPAEIAAEETIAKLLGMIPPEMDYLETQVDLLKDQVGGFYDPDTEGFYLMESFGGDLAKVILAHELTHALDDQLYDIDGTLAGMQDNGDAQLAYHAVVEGSGTGVMNAWTLRNMFKLDAKELAAAGEMGADQLEQAPPYLWKPMIGVYMKGAAFLNRTPSIMLGQVNFPELEDFETAFTEPPLSTEQILHPEKYWDKDQRDDPIAMVFEAASALPTGWEKLTEDTFGELGWGLAVEPLEKRKGMEGQLAILTTQFTYEASEGWGGDRYALLGNGDARVLVCETVWDTPDDAQEFYAALHDELGDHLLQAVIATSRARGLEGAGRTITRGPRGVVYLAWIGTDIETAEAVQAALSIQLR